MFEAAILCLALNVYHEARGESDEGQQAVAQVTLERAEWKVENVCEVVFAPRQFSWTNGLRAGRVSPDRLMPNEETAWKDALFVAHLALGGKLEHPLPQGSKHYHRADVRPVWRHGLTPFGVIGSHIFYME
jgi:N-acetylmuramoyl-L-alanine amidase